jgi:hypothetical protein
MHLKTEGCGTQDSSRSLREGHPPYHFSLDICWGSPSGNSHLHLAGFKKVQEKAASSPSAALGTGRRTPKKAGAPARGRGTI